MGVCQSGRRNSALQPHKIIHKQEDYKIIQPKLKLILKDFAIFKEFSHMLDGVAYTQNDAIDLSKGLIDGIIALQKHQTVNEKHSVMQLFTPENIRQIKNQQIFYNGILHKLNKNTKEISQTCKSRIYHTIANMKKDKNVQKQWTNKYHVNLIKNNNYKELSQPCLDQIVKYETTANHIQQMARNMNFKFQSISKQSQKMFKCLSECLVRHIGSIKGLKYDLSDHEVIKIGDISYQACSYFDNGFFILIAYFVQSCKVLSSQGQKSQDIEKLLNHAIDKISKKYPDDEAAKEPYQLIQHLKDIENLNAYNKIDFSDEEITLKSTHKQDQVEGIIKQYAKIAEESKHLLEDLMKQTCIQRCSKFKTGLKYHSKNHKNSLIKIKEKMLSLKVIQQQKNIKGTIEEILMSQQTAFGKIVDQSLEKSNKVSFKVNDMIFGKCVFQKMSEIIQAINSIKNFIKKDSRFTLKGIESRFLHKNSTSDVTLRIAINNQVTAELQLTTQANDKIYNFSSKINEMQRNITFSKLKGVHAYFEESKDDFIQLVRKILNLDIYRSSFCQQDADIISQFFKIDLLNQRSFLQILQEVFLQKNALIKDLTIVVDPLLQDLMLGIFEITIGRWYKPLGHLINNTLNNVQLSPQLKSVLLSYFFEAFQLTKQSQCMHQYSILKDQLKQKIYVEEYIRQFFEIQKAFKFTYQNQRIFQRAQQLKKIIFSHPSYNEPTILQDTSFVINSVIQEHCQQNIEKLKQLLNFYFITRKGEQETIQDNFSNYYEWISNECISIKNIDVEQLTSQISILKSQQLLESNKPEQAIKILEKALKVFKSKEEQEKIIECEILLTQCSIRISHKKLEDCIQEHNLNVKKAEMMGLDLKGALYADSMWRISEHLWERIKENEKKLLLQTFTTIAIQQMSRSKGKTFIYALIKRWEDFGAKGVRQPSIKKNQNIKYANLTDIGKIGSFYLSNVAQWDNLILLKLRGSTIGPEGCEHLSKSKWQHLTHLDLFHNEVGATGCQHLSKSKWKNLTHLNLGSNNIGSAGCGYLAKGYWENLTHLDLTSNNIGPEGCEFLIQAKWEKLTEFDFYNNNVGAQGCKILMMAKWNNLTRLDLYFNNIRDEGCEYLSKAKWEKLTNLNLFQNQIADYMAARSKFHRQNLKLTL